MSNFTLLFKVGQPIIRVINQEIERDPKWWDMYRVRTRQSNSPFNEQHDIILQYNNLSTEYLLSGKADELETISYPPMLALNGARMFVYGLMSTINGERLGRAMISSLPKGRHIKPHADSPIQYNYYQRFHLSLKDNSKTLFRCGGEYFVPDVGDVFTFDNSLEHEVWNDGETDRWSLIVDIKKATLFVGTISDEVVFVSSYDQAAALDHATSARLSDNRRDHVVDDIDNVKLSSGQ